MKNNKKPVLKLKINLVKVALAGLLILAAVPFVMAFFQTQIDESQVELSQALNDIKDGKVEKTTVQPDKLLFTYKDGSIKTTTKEESISFPELLDRAKIDPTK